MSELRYAGADVPAPYAATESTILLEFIGEPGTPAPQLQHADLDREEAEALLDRLVWTVETFLRSNWVRGDLSAFNVLYDRGRAWVIDLPQAVAARTNPHARRLLESDLANFARHGITFEAERAAGEMWERGRLGEL